MCFVVIIPARFQSSRFPGKALADLLGVPMIVRTYRQCVKAVSENDVYVATDDEKIEAVCAENGIRVIMTSNQCLTGTDRVAEAAKIVKADCYLNIQGDEPVFDPKDLVKLITAANEFPGAILNGYCPISDDALYKSKSIPKVVARPDGRLLYMSRSPIPGNKSGVFQKAWRQVCAYSFPKEALESFSSQRRKTPLEEIEDIEILRFLEMGWEVRMVEMSSESIAVDNPSDVVSVEKAILQRGL